MIKSNKSFVFKMTTACIGVAMILSSQVYAQAVKVDTVSVSDAYTRATVPGQHGYCDYGVEPVQSGR